MSGRGSPGSQIKPLRAASRREALPARRHPISPEGVCCGPDGLSVDLMTGDGPDPRLRDDDLAEEIELVTSLVLAAAQTPGPLAEEDIDRALGVDPPPDAPGG